MFLMCTMPSFVISSQGRLVKFDAQMFFIETQSATMLKLAEHLAASSDRYFPWQLVETKTEVKDSQYWT